jgi:hypothetical protein
MITVTNKVVLPIQLKKACHLIYVSLAEQQCNSCLHKFPLCLQPTGRRYKKFNYRYLLNWKFFCTPGNICECNLFFISSAIMFSFTIYLALLAQGIESQPGPKDRSSTLSILMYNCNGLGDP